ncbi:MAG: transposase [bacterium]|nr:transposase [bacterium]
MEWQHLLRQNKYKQIIIESLQFLVKKKRVIVNAFVIMDNHIHLIWQIVEPNQRKDVQRDFLKFTAQKIKYDLIENHPEVLGKFSVNAKDREYQIWERNPLTVPIWTERVLLQKLAYIHANPVKASLAEYTSQYEYSSASFYEKGVDKFGLLTHFDC